MKSILEYAGSLKQMTYKVSLVDCLDKKGLPVSITIQVDKENVDAFEEYLENEQDNLFAHAEGGNVEY